MTFSRRTAWDTADSAWSLAVRAATAGARAQGRDLLDLTVSNPTACGFDYEAGDILAPLSHPEALRYHPVPFGPERARTAVAQYYHDHGAAATPPAICLTTSTSEAYSYLFRLLCDPGDEVLVATPSYPLFDFIAGLDGVVLREYPLLYDDGWLVDLHALEAAVTPRTRAVVVVHPNNPTGNFCGAAERDALQELCARRGLALIVDEVFLDYPFQAEAPPPVTFHSEENPALTFVLSGVSKVCALPGMKCSWIVASGPAPLRNGALTRLEVIADTFLSVNSPVGYAFPAWLAGRAGIQAQIRERCRLNLARLDAVLAGTLCERLRCDGGWTAVLRVPREVPADTYGEARGTAGEALPFAEAALAAGLLLQPGSFYGLSRGRMVLSLLPAPEVWEPGIAVLASLGAAGCGSSCA